MKSVKGFKKKFIKKISQFLLENPLSQNSCNLLKNGGKKLRNIFLNKKKLNKLRLMM